MNDNHYTCCCLLWLVIIIMTIIIVHPIVFNFTITISNPSCFSSFSAQNMNLKNAVFTTIRQSDIWNRGRCFYFSFFSFFSSQIKTYSPFLRLKLQHWLFKKNNSARLYKPADTVSSPGRWAEQKHCAPPVVTSRPVVVALDVNEWLKDKESIWVKLKAVNMIIGYILGQKQIAGLDLTQFSMHDNNVITFNV